jgi:16S rRNA (guanine527-N7)-methyltransferase
MHPLKAFALVEYGAAGVAMERLQGLIEEGLAFFGIGYDPTTAGRLFSYVEELGRWMRTMNLVGLKEGGQIVGDLVYDAFFLHTRVAGLNSLLDLGSGAGIVSVPLAILNPDKQIFSLDKALKKILFQRHVKRLLGLARLEIVHGRVEEIPPLGVEALIAKAFGSAPAVLVKGGRHLREGGSAFLVKGKGEEASTQAGFLLEKMERYRLPKSDKAYQLFVYKKVS